MASLILTNAGVSKGEEVAKGFEVCYIDDMLVHGRRKEMDNTMQGQATDEEQKVRTEGEYEKKG